MESNMRTQSEQSGVVVRRLVDVDLPDFSIMTIDEITAWEPAEPDPYALLAYPLQTAEWRRAFLHDYYWVGETALFVAVAHVWSRLAPPRAERCTIMGCMSGTGGTGKAGLVLTLKLFLEEMLGVDHPFPDRGDYPSMAAWNEDAMAVFAADEADRAVLIERYEAILDGRISSAPVEPSTVIQGPWLPCRPDIARPRLRES